MKKQKNNPDFEIIIVFCIAYYIKEDIVSAKTMFLQSFLFHTTVVIFNPCVLCLVPAVMFLWPCVAGRYCVYKKGACPAGFQIGWVYWDDAAPYWGDTIQNNSGKSDTT